ncbi:Cys-tRNA(Pro) deacylase [Gynuella sp.]|uniref:Cys-tRNA(Pro) deacylase n=1 Tax=Gynuella sp. TaxID=2969146 RepID=UPI003D09773E
MTPAIQLLKKQKIPFQIHEYEVEMSGPGYGNAVAAYLGRPEEQLFKTLIITPDSQHPKLAMAIVPVAFNLDLKAVAKVLRWKKAQMSDQQKAQKATGYVVGGISPLGQKQRLPAVLDQSCSRLTTMLFSAGKRGLQIEMAPDDLIKLINAQLADIQG